MDKVANVCSTKVYGPYGPYSGNRQPHYHVDIYGAKAAGWMMTHYTLLGARRRKQIEDTLTKWKAL